MTPTKPVEPEKNSLFGSLENLPQALWDDLAALKPDDVSFRAGAPYDPQQGYTVSFLGADHLVDPEKQSIIAPPGVRPPGFQTGLVLVNYLIHASAEGLAGRMVTERDLNGGALFFQGPHALSKAPVLKRFARNGAGLLSRANDFDAVKLLDGDASFRLLALPKILVAYIFYEEDDEFPAQLTITFDASTDKHLPLDSIWALINVLSRRLAG